MFVFDIHTTIEAGLVCTLLNTDSEVEFDVTHVCVRHTHNHWSRAGVHALSHGRNARSSPWRTHNASMTNIDYVSSTNTSTCYHHHVTWSWLSWSWTLSSTFTQSCCHHLVTVWVRLTHRHAFIMRLVHGHPRLTYPGLTTLYEPTFERSPRPVSLGVGLTIWNYTWNVATMSLWLARDELCVCVMTLLKTAGPLRHWIALQFGSAEL